MNEEKVEGNKLFGDGMYEEALLKYDCAIQLAPEMSSSSEIRSICHNNRATCFFKLGKYEYTVKECNKALELNPTYMKSLFKRGEAYEKLENYDEAISDMKKILELDPSSYQAKRSIIRIEPLAAEKREKRKEDMLGTNNVTRISNKDQKLQKKTFWDQKLQKSATSRGHNSHFTWNRDKKRYKNLK